MKKIVVFFFEIVVASGLSMAVAQSPMDVERSRYSPAAHYKYAEVGDITIPVNVWGTVRNPGLYEVPQGTHLSTLFSIAGGPTISERHRRDSRAVTVRLSRSTENGREVVFETIMEDEIFVSEKDPVLQEGDVLTVETVVRERFHWRDAVTVVNAMALVALAIERFASIR